MNTTATRRRASSIGATQAQPREACLVVHYGPYHELVAEQHSLFRVAGELLTRVTPWLRYVEPIASDGVLQLPDVELPRDVVKGFFVAEEDVEEVSDKPRRAFPSRACASGAPLALPRRVPSAAAEDGTAVDANATLDDVNRRGRPVLTLTSAALGELQVASWNQWEAVQEMLLQEERNKYRTHYYEPSAGQPPSTYLLVHAELTILWFEVDTLHCLHYGDLVRAYEADLTPSPYEASDEGEQHSKYDDEEEEDEEEDADAEVEIPEDALRDGFIARGGPTPVSAPRAIAASGAAPDSVPAETTSTSLVGLAAAAAVRASLQAPSLIARLYVVDVDGVHRGQVLLPLALAPPVTLVELEQLVRAATNLRRHRAIRLSYRVLPPSSLILSTSNSPSRPDSGRVGAPGTPRDLAVSVTSTMSRYSQQPGVLSRSILKPLNAEEDVGALIEDVLLYGYRAIRLVVVETDALAPMPPSPSPQQHRQEMDVRGPARTGPVRADGDASHHRDRHHSDNEIGNDSVGVGRGTPSSSQARAHYASSQDRPVAEALAEDAEDAEDEGEDEDALVVVRYTVDPVEVHVTGEVGEGQLVWLADAIYTRCCRPDNFKPAASAKREELNSGGGVLSQRIRMRPRFLRALETSPSTAGAEKHGETTPEPAHWVLPLHDYVFSEADEDVMGLCIQEAMINSGQMTAIDPEDIQDLVDDLERELEMSRQ